MVEQDLKQVGELKFYHREKVKQIISDWTQEESEIKTQLTHEICQPDIYQRVESFKSLISSTINDLRARIEIELEQRETHDLWIRKALNELEEIAALKLIEEHKKVIS